MAKKKSSSAGVNFGAKSKRKRKAASKGTRSGAKGNAWRAYVSAPPHSNAPIPD